MKNLNAIVLTVFAIIMAKIEVNGEHERQKRCIDKPYPEEISKCSEKLLKGVDIEVPQLKKILALSPIPEPGFYPINTCRITGFKDYTIFKNGFPGKTTLGSYEQEIPFEWNGVKFSCDCNFGILPKLLLTPTQTILQDETLLQLACPARVAFSDPTSYTAMFDKCNVSSLLTGTVTFEINGAHLLNTFSKPLPGVHRISLKEIVSVGEVSNVVCGNTPGTNFQKVCQCLNTNQFFTKYIKSVLQNLFTCLNSIDSSVVHPNATLYDCSQVENDSC